MNIIDFTKNGGYRLKQFTFRKMQEAYMQILKMFVAFCNIPDVGNYIIQGCKVVGPDITSGYLYIDGELCYFTQAAGDVTSKIKKNVVIQSLGFKNGNSENVFRFTNAIIDGAGTALSGFTRVSPVFDANYNHTDNNFDNAWLSKLFGIEAGAEVNVQADWDVINPLSDAFIKNKPNIPNVLYANDAYIGDIGTSDLNPDTNITITFPDVGTSDYQPVCTPVVVTGTGNSNNDFSYVILSRTPTSFSISLRGYSSDTQDIRMYYILFKTP